MMAPRTDPAILAERNRPTMRVGELMTALAKIDPQAEVQFFGTTGTFDIVSVEHLPSVVEPDQAMFVGLYSRGVKLLSKREKNQKRMPTAAKKGVEIAEKTDATDGCPTA